MKFHIKDTEIAQDDIIGWANHEDRSTDADWIKNIATTVTEWHSAEDSISIQTSGSTGTPKQIWLSKSSMEASVHKTAERFGLRAGMLSLLCLPSRYIAGKMMIIRALVLGLDQICIPPKLALTIPRRRYDFAAMTPMQLEMTMSADLEAIHHIRTLILGGAPILPKLIHKIQELPTECHATYGMTETITHVATRPVNGAATTDVFEAVSGVYFDTHEDNLVIHADHLNEDRIITTDQVSLLDKTHFRWIGRSDDAINVGGVKIHPARVESLLDDYIQDTFIITGVPDPNSGYRVILLIESEPYDMLGLQGLNTKFNYLEKLERPREIHFTERFLKTPTGKIRRQLDLYKGAHVIVVKEISN